MKQATGSNASRFTNKVSIQQSLDGHSFSVSGLEWILPGSEAVTVEVLTPQTLLVPAELFDAGEAAGLLAAAGMACTQGQQAIWTPATRIAPRTDAVAVMAATAQALQMLEERLGDRAVFTTPLLDKTTDIRPSVRLHYRGGILYIKVFADTLRMAETIPAASEADIRYLVDRLAQAFPLKRMRLTISGSDSKRVRKLVGDRFGKVVCES
ncbi:MAG: hypothetical protein K2L06_05765 [Alistipes sp.]|nr:hypothetical protein [Alistipes sp.]